MRMEIKDFFEAQHQLPDTEFLATKACHAYHGHSYKVVVKFDGEQLRGGMIVDFKGIKQLIAQLDHTAIYQKGNSMIDFINKENTGQVVVVLEEPPSSENIAKHIYQLIQDKYCSFGIKNLSVAVCEGYKGEERSNWTTYEEN